MYIFWSDIYIYIYICTWMHLFYDIGLVVRTWMRFMMFDMFVLHMDASSLGCLARGCPLCILCDVT